MRVNRFLAIIIVVLFLVPTTADAHFSPNRRQAHPAISATSYQHPSLADQDQASALALFALELVADAAYGFNGGLNLYSYANQNPLRWVDPFGLIPDLSPLLNTLLELRDSGWSQPYTGWYNRLDRINDSWPEKDVSRALGEVFNAAEAHLNSLPNQCAQEGIFLQGFLGEFKNIPGFFNETDLALGLTEFLHTFKGSAQIGTSIVLQPGETLMDGIKRAIFEQASSGGKIRFNLKGFDVQDALNSNSANFQSYTSQEFRTIISNPFVLRNTVFYDSAGKILSPAVLHALIRQ